jgi:bifunctional non-homologous end joining protein LigD
MPFVRLPEAFNDADWLFELKLDGFRALAYIEHGTCALVSRNGHTLRRFAALAQHLADTLPVRTAILDGEIVCLDADGRSVFNRVMCSRADPVFAAFDLLWLDGRDLRDVPLIERKQRLADVVRAGAGRVLLVQHVERSGVDLFAAACEHDPRWTPKTGH